MSAARTRTDMPRHLRPHGARWIQLVFGGVLLAMWVTAIVMVVR